MAKVLEALTLILGLLHFLYMLYGIYEVMPLFDPEFLDVAIQGALEDPDPINPFNGDKEFAHRSFLFYRNCMVVHIVGVAILGASWIVGSSYIFTYMR